MIVPGISKLRENEGNFIVPLYILAVLPMMEDGRFNLIDKGPQLPLLVKGSPYRETIPGDENLIVTETLLSSEYWGHDMQ